MNMKSIRTRLVLVWRRAPHRRKRRDPLQRGQALGFGVKR